MPSFVTEDEVKAWMRDPDADTSVIAILIPAASEAIEDFCSREFTPTDDVERTLFYNGSGVLSLAPNELRAVTEFVAVGWPDFVGTAGDLPQYGLRGATKQGTFLWLSLPRYVQPTYDLPPTPYIGWDVRIRGDWGCQEVPHAVKVATLITVANEMASPEGFASRESGGISVSEATVLSSAHLPDAAKGWLEPLVRGSGTGV